MRLIHISFSSKIGWEIYRESSAALMLETEVSGLVVATQTFCIVFRLRRFVNDIHNEHNDQ